MSSISSILALLSIPLIATILAWVCGIAPFHFWITPLAAALPWLLPFAVVLVFAELAPDSLKQGFVMTGLFPLLAMFGSFGIASIASFFLGRNLTLWQRFIGPFTTTAIPAVLMTIGLTVVFVLDIKASKSVNTNSSNSEIAGSEEKKQSPGDSK